MGRPDQRSRLHARSTIFPVSDNACIAAAVVPHQRKARRWTAVIGIPPLVVRAYERADRRSVVFARWVDPQTRGRERRRKRSLEVKIRDAHGRLDPSAVALAEARLRELYAAIVRDEDLDASQSIALPLTLEEGFRAALATDGGGIYIGKTAHARSMEIAAARVMAILGEAVPWAELLPLQLSAVWRHFARASSD